MIRFNLQKLVSAGMLVTLLGTSFSLLSTIADTQASDAAKPGFPGRRVGGGTRGDCSTTGPLISLVPQDNVSVTTSAHPSLWFYVSASKSMQNMEFVLYDQTNKLVYETIVPTPEQSGIVRIALPNSEKLSPLAIDETYHWYLSMVCPVTRAADISVNGGLRRIAAPANLPKQLESATPLKQAKLYREAGIWSDALTILANLYSTQSADPQVAGELEQLLQTADLGSKTNPLFRAEKPKS
ncbi:MAG: DUF928 domain-containing protein [Kovacikia sp.]